jgi:hypothetical protein
MTSLDRRPGRARLLVLPSAVVISLLGLGGCDGAGSRDEFGGGGGPWGGDGTESGDDTEPGGESGDDPGDDSGDGPGDGSGDGDGNEPGDGETGEPERPDSPLVDPDCIDGQFAEILPNPLADLSDLEAGYSPGAAVEFVLDVLLRRYTTGYEVCERGSDASFDCVDVFLDPSGAAGEIYSQLPTVVHECGHSTDFNLGGFDEDAYLVNDSPLELRCTGGDSTDRGGRTFARSRIRDDEYQGLNPNDFYAGIYLDGDPDDDNFDGGDQGFNSVLEETLQYINSIATAYAFNNELNTGGWVSHRDGILTFLWYLTRYLRMGRLDYPDAHDYLLTGEDGCWRRAILTVWGRAWLYLGVTEDMDHLGIDDDFLFELVQDPDLVDEIQRMRDAEGCPPP